MLNHLKDFVPSNICNLPPVNQRAVNRFSWSLWRPLSYMPPSPSVQGPYSIVLSWDSALAVSTLESRS